MDSLTDHQAFAKKGQAASVISEQGVNADKIGFFFGADAYIEFGIPSMKQMTSSFSRKINKGLTQKEEIDSTG